MEKYKINFEEDIPKYIQVSNHIRNLIDSNTIKDGEKLPTIRTMVNFLGLNKITIVNAYKRLENEGYVSLKMGSGSYAKRKENVISFNKEYSNTLKQINTEDIDNIVDFTGETNRINFFPIESLKKVINEVLDRDGADALVSKDSLGYRPLREIINKEFWNEKNNIEDILIVSGAQQGIDIASKALINVNDNIVVERPTYSGAVSVFKWRRANVFEIPIEEDGIDIKSFENLLKKNPIKCFYTMSYFQNPTGFSYSLEKKKRILELADKYDFYIIEDDYLSELIYEKSIDYTPFKALDKNDRVVYIKSFSKIFLPGIRLGYVITPKKFREGFQTSKINTDITTSSLMQRALDLYIRRDYWKEHINYVNKIFNERYFYMDKCMKEMLGDLVSYYKSGGGLSYLVRINSDITSRELFYRLRERNVLISPGVLYYKKQGEGDKYFRIGFSQTTNDKIELGINEIRKVLKNKE